jgi:hypothetical protein
MKGKLIKTDQGWIVEYAKHAELPLHPDDVIDVEQHIEATSISHNLNANMEVEFKIVHQVTDAMTDEITSFAKLKQSKKY